MPRRRAICAWLFSSLTVDSARPRNPGQLRGSRAAGRSVDGGAGRLDDLRPLRELRAAVGGELVGRVADRFRAQSREPLAHVRYFDDLRDLARELADDFLRRTRR